MYNLSEMKRLLTILILIFTLQTPSLADDIRDFQIEGMSIGDSLLDYFTEEEILANKPNWFKNNEYSIANDLYSENFETYIIVQAAYKTKDKKYILEGLEGYKLFDNVKECFKIQDNIINELNVLFKNLNKSKKKTLEHPAPDNKSIITNISYYFENDDKVMVGCVDREDKTADLRVILRAKNYGYFIDNKAYK